LRAQSAGVSLMFVPLVLVALNVTYTLSAYPAGILSDRMNRVSILILGLSLLVVADLTLAFAPGLLGVFAGVVIWGLHMGFTQGILTTMVADGAPPELRGTAFGMFNLMTGVALLVASVIAGGLWDTFGAEWTFLAGAAFALLSIVGLIPLHRKLAGRKQDQTKAEGTTPKDGTEQG
jgi:MFS family permease